MVNMNIIRMRWCEESSRRNELEWVSLLFLSKYSVNEKDDGDDWSSFNFSRLFSLLLMLSQFVLRLSPDPQFSPPKNHNIRASSDVIWVASFRTRESVFVILLLSSHTKSWLEFFFPLLPLFSLSLTKVDDEDLLILNWKTRVSSSSASLFSSTISLEAYLIRRIDATRVIWDVTLRLFRTLCLLSLIQMIRNESWTKLDDDLYHLHMKWNSYLWLMDMGGWYKWCLRWRWSAGIF